MQSRTYVPSSSSSMHKHMGVKAWSNEIAGVQVAWIAVRVRTIRWEDNLLRFNFWIRLDQVCFRADCLCPWATRCIINRDTFICSLSSCWYVGRSQDFLIIEDWFANKKSQIGPRRCYVRLYFGRREEKWNFEEDQSVYDRRRTTVATFKNGLCLVGNVGDLGAKREGKREREREERKKREIPRQKFLSANFYFRKSPPLNHSRAAELVKFGSPIPSYQYQYQFAERREICLMSRVHVDELKTDTKKSLQHSKVLEIRDFVPTEYRHPINKQTTYRSSFRCKWKKFPIPNRVTSILDK